MNGNTPRGFTLAVALACICLPLLHGRAASPAGDDKAARQQGTRDAATLYAKNCATCHGKDGRAGTFKARFNHARDLTDATWQAGASDEHLYNSISHGKGKMPAFGKKLSEAEINGLVAYVRRFRR